MKEEFTPQSVKEVVCGVDFNLFKNLIPHFPLINQDITERIIDSILMNTAEYNFKIPLNELLATISFLCSAEYTPEAEAFFKVNIFL